MPSEKTNSHRLTVTLPNYTAEELQALRLGGGWITAPTQWVQGDVCTRFRKDMQPHQDRDDDSFRVVVPMSGGIDSATVYQMAKQAGLDVVPVMLNTGVPYARYDQAAAERLTNGTLQVIDAQHDWQTTSDFQLGRNSVIVWHLLKLFTVNGWWGEIWFGNLGANYLETPIVGGDKSFRWMSAMQQMAVSTGHDVHLCSPLIGMAKSDCVRWWSGRWPHSILQLLEMRSCFADQPEHCGHCWACLYRYVAFAVAGYGDLCKNTYPDGIDFTEPAAEFWRRTQEWNLVTTCGLRIDAAAGVMHKLGLGYDWWQRRQP